MALREIILVSCLAISLAMAGKSPHADIIEVMYKQLLTSGRISDNIIEDATLDVPELVRKYNYPLEEHTVTTEDGYILTIHRIPHGRDNNNVPGDRPIVFLMHGLVSSSADFILLGPGCSLAYILAEEGFDVWLGNARGNYYSRKHIRLNPDSWFSTAFWQFSWDEIGRIDVPTMIDYALAVTGRERLHYIGHSQGTTTFFVLGSLRPEYNEKIISMHALAPSAFMEHSPNLLLRFISQFANNMDGINRSGWLKSLGICKIDTIGIFFQYALSLLGVGEFFPNNNVMTWAGQALCMDEVVFQPLCSNIIFLLGGWNEDQHNATMIPVKMGHSPAGASARQFLHYAQGIASRQFRRYDHGTWLANRRAYGTRTPPRYDLSKITTPVFLHYSDTDPLAHVDDVDRLFRELGRPVGKFRIAEPKFSHFDFIWAIKGRELLYDRIINLIRSMDVNGRTSTV